MTKGQAYVAVREDPSQPSVFDATDKALHRQRRKIVAPLISERAMRAFEPEMSREVNLFLRLLLRSSRRAGGKKAAVVNMSHRCENLAVDVVGHLSFGYDLRSQTEPLHRRVIDGIKARSRRGSLLFAWGALRPAFNLLDRALPLVPGMRGRYVAAVEGWYESLRTMINARMALARDAKDDFYARATATAAGSGVQGEEGEEEQGADRQLVTKELWAESVLLVAAGGSTTSIALAATFFYLSRNPAAHARLAAEIRTSFASGREIAGGPRLAACAYLRAVLDEALRLAPGTPAPWREQDAASAAAGEAFVVDGNVVPPGTQVAINLFCLMRNAAYFERPLEFRPERWLEAEAGDNGEEGGEKKNKEGRAVMRRAFVPFILGERACAGKAMAYLELSLVVAKTVWYFDFEKAPGEAGRLGEDPCDPRLYRLLDSIIVGNDGPNLVFTPRAEYWRELEGRED